jgi:murein L,D-transpeptidase YafK
MKSILLLTTLFLFMAFVAADNFITQQKKYERVRIAYAQKADGLKQKLQAEHINFNTLNILLVAYKEEQQLLLYAKNKSDGNYKKISTYTICASSGTLGPKRKQGDGQVPEGFYHIATFNPASSYYLSLGINYPNKADIKKSTATNLGGDIFIHGECVTIGCLPMTNDKIQELYVLATTAHKNNEQHIPVYIFPFKLTDQNIKKHNIAFKDNAPLLRFWDNLKVGYDAFEKENKALTITIDKNGNYTF